VALDGVDQAKGLSQLLLSPLFLFREVLGTIIPGALLLLLLAYKGSPVLHHVWLDSPFGYRTKIALFLLLAYIVGKALVTPLLFVIASRRIYGRIATEVRAPTAGPPAPPGGRPGPEGEAASYMLQGAVVRGPILWTRGLEDRLSILQSNAAFHVGTGCALLVAAAFPGDNLRGTEALLGFAMLVVGIHLGHESNKEYVRFVGTGLFDRLVNMTPQQIQIVAAWLNAVKARAEGAGEAPQQPAVIKAP
jgi:hypothetical protein